jgi:hypothetical protein
MKGKESEDSQNSMARLKDRKQPARERKCAICESRQPGKVEIYQFRDELDTYIFRNDTAKELVSAGRNAIPITAESLLHLLGMNYFDEGHLGHVDPAKPGICTRRFGGLILLDGIHRAVRCLAEKRPFLAHELSYEESLDCLVQQQVCARDAEAIARKLRQALEYFPRNVALDTPIECSAEMLEQAAGLLTAQELEKFNLRAVPSPA